MKISVLVTGGAGYIGSQVSADLLDNGFNVVVLDNLSTGRRALVPNEAKFIEGDITAENHLDEVFRTYSPDWVVHMAAFTQVNESVLHPLKYYKNNLGGTLNVLKFMQKYRTKGIVFSSTAAVYGNVEEPEVSELTPTNPMSPYGQSKLYSEYLIRNVTAAYGIQHVIFRYFNVAGADPLLRRGQETPFATHLVKVAAEAACGKRRQVEVYGADYNTPDGTCIRDFIHVGDLAKTHVMALQYMESSKASDTFNVGYGHGYSVRELLQCMQSVSGEKFNIIESARRAGDIPSIYANCKKIKQVLGFQPKYDDLSLICRTAYEYEAQRSK